MLTNNKLAGPVFIQGFQAFSHESTISGLNENSHKFET